MTPDLALVLGLLAVTIALFTRGSPRGDAVAFLALVALPLAGLVEVREVIAGFGNPNIVLIAAMFVIGEGLARTGVAQRLGDWLVERGGTDERRLIALLMLAVAALGSVMYSAGVVAIFIPIALRVAAKTGTTAARFLMPVSYAALLSGTLTLVAAAPNLIVNYELIRHGAEGLDFFSLTPVGLPIVLAGVLYMVLARGGLAGGAASAKGQARPQIADWVETYGLAGREHRLRIGALSPLVGRPLSDLDLPAEAQARVIALERHGPLGHRTMPASPDTPLAAGDVLLIDTHVERFDAGALCDRLGLERLPLTGAYFSDRAQDIGMAEAILTPDSRLLGRTLGESGLRGTDELSAVGLRRGCRTIAPERLYDLPLEPGDTLLLAGPWKLIRALQGGGRDLLALHLPRELDQVLPAADRAPHAMLALGVTVGLMISGLVPPVLAALIGCVLMVALGCIDLDSAYRSIGMRTLVTIVGMLPFAVALERTGGIALASGGLIALVGDLGPHLILATLFALTVLLGLFIVAAANAVLVIPIALAMADALHASPYPFALTVMLAASCAFMTPVSPINAMVATAGQYQFGDFARMGLPLTLIAGVITVTLVPWLWPL